jgi:hypothetical protein
MKTQEPKELEFSQMSHFICRRHRKGENNLEELKREGHAQV